MCFKNEKCEYCDYQWDCPHANSEIKKDNKVGISTHTVHLATRFEDKETVVLINGKEYPIQKIGCKGNKVILIVTT